MRKRTEISLPHKLVWSTEDWKDLYFTLKAFKLRVLKRHGLDERGKKVKQ